MERKFYEMKSQAAITDAIILLLVSIFSSVLIFNFVGTWGEDQDQVLRSAYVLNYMQSVSKALYYVDASTLTGVGSDGIDVYKKALTQSGFETNAKYDLDDSDDGCAQLQDYPGTLRVTDLMKRDLADSDPTLAVGGAMPKLDDSFGTPPGGARVPGRTAVRCALKELMKPFSFSGYKYYFEAILSQDAPGIAGGTPQGIVHYIGPEITNSKDLNVVGVETAGGYSNKAQNGAASEVPGCFSALRSGYQILAVSSPFQVLYSDTSGGSLDSKFIKYKTRICIWQSKEDFA
ncbi:MAG: hypothetical protein QXR53_03330 [Candidatus Norongarragalinales archaeon]